MYNIVDLLQDDTNKCESGITNRVIFPIRLEYLAFTYPQSICFFTLLFRFELCMWLCNGNDHVF